MEGSNRRRANKNSKNRNRLYMFQMPTTDYVMTGVLPFCGGVLNRLYTYITSLCRADGTSERQTPWLSLSHLITTTKWANLRLAVWPAVHGHASILDGTAGRNGIGVAEWLVLKQSTPP